MSEALVEAVGLAVELGGRRVVDGVSLRALPGQVVAVVGPNGAGKTTLLRALAGLVTSSGELRIDGEDPRSASAQANARHRAYCAQKPACAWDYRVRDLGEFGAVLLLDEPAASLDIARQALVAAEIRRFAQAGGAAIVATHDLSFARSCDLVVVLEEGRLTAAGDPLTALTPTVIAATWGASAQAEA